MVSFAAWATARFERRRERLRRTPFHCQDDLAGKLATWFSRRRVGQGLALESVRSARGLSRAIPLRNYAQHRDNFEKPKYWALTSGTTSDEKAIPVTTRLLKANASSFTLVMATALRDLGSLAPLAGKILFLGSCTPLELGEDGVWRGAGTSIAMHERPFFYRRNVLPGNRLDHLPTWQEKLEELATMTVNEDVRVVAGTPPWLLSLCDHIKSERGVTNLRTLWPHLRLVLTGGTFLEPYRDRLDAALGPVTWRNIFSATEGFFAFQDGDAPGLLPLSDSIFFEFIPVDQAGEENPDRLLLQDVLLDVEYAMVITSWAGLLGYLVGDTVRFVSLDPPRFVVCGRIQARANLAGEKVSLEQIELAASRGAARAGVTLTEFSMVAVGPDDSRDGRPRHHWLVESETRLENPTSLAAAIDESLCELSSTYRVRRQGQLPALGPPSLEVLPVGSHLKWLVTQGRAGGHHKVPRLFTSRPESLINTGE